MSFGLTDEVPPTDFKDFRKQLRRCARAGNRLMVASVGNDGIRVKRYPAAFPEVLGVAGAVNSGNGDQWAVIAGGASN